MKINRGDESFIKKPITGLSIVLLVGIIAGQFALRYILGSHSALDELTYWKNAILAPVPNVCAVCGKGNGTEYHAPALVNLSTREVGELRVYESSKAGTSPSIASIQNVGTFYFSKCAGLTGWVETYSHTHTIEIPQKGDPIVMEHYCRDCRALLASVSSCGYVLLDLYDVQHIRAYALQKDFSYDIREYEVSVFQDKNNDDLTVKVRGKAEGLVIVD